MKTRIITFLLIFILLGACNGKVPGADARKIPPNAQDRIKQNMKKEEDLPSVSAEKKFRRI